MQTKESRAQNLIFAQNWKFQRWCRVATPGMKLKNPPNNNGTGFGSQNPVSMGR
jgi:hypothetical protein